MRVALLGALLAGLGIVALPVTAYFLDATPLGEDLVLPVDVAVCAAAGAGLGALVLPGTWSRTRRVAVGAGLGVAGAAVGLVLFFLLISGLSGA
jgi:hypothetical protein